MSLVPNVRGAQIRIRYYNSISGPRHTRVNVVEKSNLFSTRLKFCSLFACRPPPWRNFEFSTDERFSTLNSVEKIEKVVENFSTGKFL